MRALATGGPPGGYGTGYHQPRPDSREMARPGARFAAESAPCEARIAKSAASSYCHRRRGWYAMAGSGYRNSVRDVRDDRGGEPAVPRQDKNQLFRKRGARAARRHRRARPPRHRHAPARLARAGRGRGAHHHRARLGLGRQARDHGERPGHAAHRRAHAAGDDPRGRPPDRGAGRHRRPRVRRADRRHGRPGRPAPAAAGDRGRDLALRRRRWLPAGLPRPVRRRRRSTDHGGALRTARRDPLPPHGRRQEDRGRAERADRPGQRLRRRVRVPPRQRHLRGRTGLHTGEHAGRAAERVPRAASSRPRARSCACRPRCSATRSTPSGYAWSSSDGPPDRVSTGTSCTARVVLSRAAPITYAFPALGRLVGGSE